MSCVGEWGGETCAGEWGEERPGDREKAAQLKKSIAHGNIRLIAGDFFPHLRYRLSTSLVRLRNRRHVIQGREHPGGNGG